MILFTTDYIVQGVLTEFYDVYELYLEGFGRWA